MKQAKHAACAQYLDTLRRFVLHVSLCRALTVRATQRVLAAVISRCAYGSDFLGYEFPDVMGVF